MASRIRLTVSQRDDVATICEIGPKILGTIAERISSAQFTIRRYKIDTLIRGELDEARASALSRFLFGVAAGFRQSSATVDETFEAIDRALEASKGDSRFETWTQCRPVIRRLLSIPSLTLAAKALSVAYDSERVFVAGRVITSVRPVFDDQREEILGSSIVQTLRLEHIDSGGHQRSFSIAMDIEDIDNLITELTRAVRKAKATRLRIEKDCRIEAIVAGDEGE